MNLPAECMKKGHPSYGGGRPRTTTPEPEELIKLGKELVAWAEEDTKEWRARFCDWYSTIHGMTDKEWELMTAKSEFQGYYKQAQTALSKKWLNGSINPSIAHRFIRIYCPEVKKEEDDKILFELRAKAEAEVSAHKAISREIEEKFERVMDQISKDQKDHSERKIASTKVPKE